MWCPQTHGSIITRGFERNGGTGCFGLTGTYARRIIFFYLVIESPLLLAKAR